MENIFQRPPILMRLTMLTRDKISLLRAASLRTARETAHGLNDRKQRGGVEAGMLPLNYSRFQRLTSTNGSIKHTSISNPALRPLLTYSLRLSFLHGRIECTRPGAHQCHGPADPPQLLRSGGLPRFGLCAPRDRMTDSHPQSDEVF